MDRMPKAGEFYRHFKNKLYQIVTVAVHSETGEAMVVYQALYGDYKTYVRPLEMFISPVDREKYPDVRQEYRFERVTFELEERRMDTEERKEECAGEEPMSPLFFEFLDAASMEEKLAVLNRMSKEADGDGSVRALIGQRDLDGICLALDMKPAEGSVEEQLINVREYVKMQIRYDGSRLRGKQTYV